MPYLYDHPKYYEIAFSFRNIPAEVNLFEECFNRFSLIPVKSVLELGCGNCPHMIELVKRGYQYNGLDTSKPMIEYSKQKARHSGITVNLIPGNMIDFSLKIPADFVFINLGSLYVKNTAELTKHFDSVANALKKGGLFFLDWCIQYPPLTEEGESWEIEKEGIHVKTTVSSKYINPVEQLFEENIILEVNDHGKHHTLAEKGIRRAIFPQEFLGFVNSRQDFEFIGCWNNWDLSKPLEKATKANRPITLIRRT